MVGGPKAERQPSKRNSDKFGPIRKEGAGKGIGVGVGVGAEIWIEKGTETGQSFGITTANLLARFAFLEI